MPFEFLCWDNASDDRRIIDYISSLKPAWYHLHRENIGYAPAVNQLIINALHSKDQIEFICILDPDLKMPRDWLKIAVEHYEAIPNSGLIAYHCALDKAPETVLHGKKVHVQGVYGIKFLNMAMLRKTGYFCEKYGKYGIEDVDYNHRAWKLGFVHYYIGNGMRCEHLGGARDPENYRMMKVEALKKAVAVHEQQMRLYDQGLELYVPPPQPLALRDW
jgi:GT2 family glycosyltransferase